MDATVMLLGAIIHFTSRTSSQAFVSKGADLYFQCDNVVTRVEYTHANGDPKPQIWSYESVGWQQEVHVILSNICSGDMINIYCENAYGNDQPSNPGGFIATLKFQGKTYSTRSYGYKQGHGPWIMWRSRRAGGGWEQTWAADLKANRGGGPWGGNVGSNIASDAQWIFRNGYQAIQTQFRFSGTYGSTNLPPACSSSAHIVDGNLLEGEQGDLDELGDGNKYLLVINGKEMYLFMFLVGIVLVMVAMNVTCCLKMKQGKDGKTVSYAKVATVSPSDNENNNFL